MGKFCLVVLCGLPAAGKTTLSHKLLEMSNAESGYSILHLCYDNLINIMDDYKRQRAEILEMLAIIIKSLKEHNILPQNIDKNKFTFKHNAHSQDYVIICDDNHYYRSMRYKLLQLSRQHVIAYAQIYFQITLEQSIAVNAKRHGAESVPIEILKQMAARLEAPNPNANSWEANGRTLTLTPPSFDIQTILSYIKERLQHNEETSLVKTQTSMPMSRVHELDILLRRRLNLMLGSFVAGKGKQLKAAELNNLRRQILADFKCLDLSDGDGAVDYDTYLNLLE